MKYRIQICTREYNKCYTACVDELHVLDLHPEPTKMKPKDREIFIRLKEKLGGSKHW